MHKHARIESPLRGSEIIGDCLPKARGLALGRSSGAAPQLKPGVNKKLNVVLVKSESNLLISAPLHGNQLF
jgi:hypothetical protein